jgi:hypothetical protein
MTTTPGLGTGTTTATTTAGTTTPVPAVARTTTSRKQRPNHGGRVSEGAAPYDVRMPRIAHWIWFPFGVTIRFIGRNGKRIGVSIAGFVLVIGGLAMLVLPGPGLLLIIAGLAVLATEYVWAQRALNFAKQKAEQAKNKVLGKKQKSDPEGPAPTSAEDP